MKKLVLFTVLGALMSFSVILPKEANAAALTARQIGEICDAMFPLSYFSDCVDSIQGNY